MSESRPRPPFTIRHAKSNDSQAILECLAVAFAPYRTSYTPRAFADTVLDSESVQERLRDMHVLVAVSERVIVGTLAWAASGGDGHLRGMAVLQDWQGEGVAAALLRAAEAEARGEHCTRLTLTTTEPLDQAKRFYARHGFTRSGRVFDFFGMPLQEWIKSL